MSPATTNPTNATRTQVSPVRVPSRTTWPPVWLQNPTQTPVAEEVSAYEDWPEAWTAEFNAMAAENRALGHSPSEAARLAYEALKVRAAGLDTRGDDDR